MDQNMEMVDRISQLPEPIIHHILSFLPIKEVLKTQVLSKTWNHVWNTFPILEFNKAFLVEILGSRWIGLSTNARRCYKILRKRDELLNFVEQTLLSRYRQMLSVNKFTLYMPFCDSNWVPLMDRCIGCAIECNVKELHIDIVMLDHKQCKLLEIMFDHFGAKLPNVRYSSLKRQFLSGVYVDDHAVQNLPNSCPEIEDLSFSKCGGLKSLQVSGFLQLKKVNVKKCYELKRVDIEAPNLQYFKYHYERMYVPVEINITSCKNMKTLILYGANMTEKSFHDHISVFAFLEKLELCCCDNFQHIKISGSLQLKKVNVQKCIKLKMVDIEAPDLQYFKYDYDKMHVLGEINITSCNNMKTLILYGANMTEKSLHDHISVFPLLENLELRHCNMLEHIKISSCCLKKLILYECQKLVEAKIDAPYLCSFKYWGRNMVLLSMNALALSRAELFIQYPPKVIDTFWYVKLLEFLGQLNSAKELNLIFYTNLKAIIIPKELRQSLIPPSLRVNHLTLQMSPRSHTIVESVDGVLWMYSHLDSLSMKSDCYNISFKFVYEKQLDREENIHWQHCLKEAKIVYEKLNREEYTYYDEELEEKIEGAEAVWNLKKFFFENAKNFEKVDVIQ